MHIKILKLKVSLKRNLVKLWYFLMKPIAYVVIKVSDIRYKRLVDKCKNMSDGELIRRFAKYLIKDMIRRNETKKDFVVFSKMGSSNTRELDEEQLINNEIRNINYKCKDRRLKNWHYHSKKADLWYEFKDKEEQFPAYEKRLNELLKLELDRIGVRNEYINIKEIGYKNQDGKYDFYGRYLNDIGYEKTLVIYL